MPDWNEEIRKQLADLNLAPAREAEIVEELAQHAEDRYQELQSSGARRLKPAASLSKSSAATNCWPGNSGRRAHECAGARCSGRARQRAVF